MDFQITPEQWTKFHSWQVEQDKKVIETQKERHLFPDEPYYGAIGGGYTFSFTPTSIGLIIQISNNVTKEMLDVTDYENW